MVSIKVQNAHSLLIVFLASIAQPIVVSTIPRPKNYLALSILSCLFGNLIVGLVAIMFSCMVSGFLCILENVLVDCPSVLIKTVSQ